jgi:hypothetical protein
MGFLRPRWGRGKIEKQTAFHGLRSAPLAAGCAPPVATSLRPVGAKRGRLLRGRRGEWHALRVDGAWLGVPWSSGGVDE